MSVDFHGCGTALVTPFDERGRLDFGALEGLVEWQIQENIDFLVTCTPAGESPTLSGEERRAVTARVVKVADGRLPILAGAGGNHTAKSVFWARDAEQAGANAILSILPYYNHPTPDGLVKHFSAISDATRLPIFVYNLPARTGTDLSPETLLRLADIPRISGLCEGTRDFGKAAILMARTPEKFAVLSADDLTGLAALSLGMRGVVSSNANIAPGSVGAMFRSALENRWDEAREHFGKLVALCELDSLESSPGPLKTALAMMGRCTETVRAPLSPVREDTRRKVEKMLRSLKLLPKGLR